MKKESFNDRFINLQVDVSNAINKLVDVEVSLPQLIFTSESGFTEEENNEIIEAFENANWDVIWNYDCWDLLPELSFQGRHEEKVGVVLSIRNKIVNLIILDTEQCEDVHIDGFNTIDQITLLEFAGITE